MMTSAIVPFAAGLACCAAHDVRTRRIPNALCATLAVLGLGARLYLDGPGALASGLLGAIAGLALLLVPFAMGLCGGGDVKLLAAIGAWLGTGAIVPAAAAGLVSGGLLSAAIAVTRWREVRQNLWLTVATGRPHASATRVPLGLALAAGALACAVLFGGLPHA